MEGIIAIGDYVQKNIGDGYESSVFLEKLILLDNDVLLELFNRLVKGTIILEDVMLIKDINDTSIRNLIYKSDMGDSSKATTYKGWKDFFDINLSFKANKEFFVKNYELYVRNSLIRFRNYRVEIKYDIFDPERYLNEYIEMSREYSDYIRKYNFSYMESRKILEKRIELLPWDGKNLLNLLDYVIDNQVLLDTPYSKAPSRRDKDVVDFFAMRHRIEDSARIDIIHDNIITSLVNSEEDYSGAGLSLVLKKAKESESNQYKENTNIVQAFREYKIYHSLYLNRVYKKYRSSEDINLHSNKIKYIEEVFDLVAQCLQDIFRLTEELVSNYDLMEVK